MSSLAISLHPMPLQICDTKNDRGLFSFLLKFYLLNNFFLDSKKAGRACCKKQLPMSLVASIGKSNDKHLI